MDVVAVETREDHIVFLRFEDGSERTVDLTPYLYGPVFERVREDPDFFSSVRVDPAAGTIVWPNGADLAPEVLYLCLPSARMANEARIRP